MSGWKKLASAAAATGDFLNVEDVFSSYLYEGSGSTNQSITNGIDLSTEGGLVWIKNRSLNSNHYLVDTERGALKFLQSNLSTAEDTTTSTGVNAFNTDGFDVDGIGAVFNSTLYDYVSWTFRKAPKFFDVVTYTGDGVNGRSISHSLNHTVGMIIVKCRSTSSTNWVVWHRGASGTLWLDTTNADSANGGGQATSGIIYNPGSNTTSFSVDGGPFVNQTGRTYVAYLFAHNNGDGDFGPTGDQDIIKCGNYSKTGGTALDVDLGFEPEWVMVKRVDAAGYWMMTEYNRGQTLDDSNNLRDLLANDGAGEASSNNLFPTSNGFRIGALANDYGATGDYIYIAIRKKIPNVNTLSNTDLFKVFKVDNSVASAPSFADGDMVISSRRSTTYMPRATDRLTGISPVGEECGQYFETGSGNLPTTYLGSASAGLGTDNVFGVNPDNSVVAVLGGSNGGVAWWWRRATGYFTMASWFGAAGSASIPHNLGAVPEMIWAKNLASTNFPPYIYHKDINGGVSPEDYYYALDTTTTPTNDTYWNDTAPTATHFSVANRNNNSSGKYIAYLFASVAGLSKVGSYTGTGTAQNIDCGFSSGARFVFIRAVSVNDNTKVWDSERGIVAGDDPYLLLNANDAEYTSDDYIDPYSAGFTADGQNNVSGREYIFYAVA